VPSRPPLGSAPHRPGSLPGAARVRRFFTLGATSAPTGRRAARFGLAASSQGSALREETTCATRTARVDPVIGRVTLTAAARHWVTRCDSMPAFPAASADLRSGFKRPSPDCARISFRTRRTAIAGNVKQHCSPRRLAETPPRMVRAGRCSASTRGSPRRVGYEETRSRRSPGAGVIRSQKRMTRRDRLRDGRRRIAWRTFKPPRGAQRDDFGMFTRAWARSARKRPIRAMKVLILGRGPGTRRFRLRNEHRAVRDFKHGEKHA